MHITKALEWNCPIPLLLSEVFFENIDAENLIKSPKWEELVTLVEHQWNFTYPNNYFWWPETNDLNTKLKLCSNILIIAKHFPWKPFPGSIEDVISQEVSKG